MRIRAIIFFALLMTSLLVLLTISLGGAALAQSAKSDDGNAARVAPVAESQPADARLEGEKRFHSNCGRCHQAPPKFPPRMMATIIRHMRVRATITDEEMRLILKYMTQ
jgi:mono/diheme cytochrome c family protein